MDKIKAFCRDRDWEAVGELSFYAYFAINILMKAFSYDHGDNIYKCFFYTAIIFWLIKLLTTRYTLREVFWIALLLSVGVMLSVVTRQNMWLLSIMTVIGMKNCRFWLLVQLAVSIRTLSLIVLTVGAAAGIYDIGLQTTLDSEYVETKVYGFAMGEPNTAYLTVFLALVLLLYYYYDRLNIIWFVGTSAVALFFYKFTLCRTGVLVFFFCWALILFEKWVKWRKAMAVLALSVPVGGIFSLVMMLLYDGENAVMSQINHLVSGRIYIMNTYFKDQGISLFPRTQEVFYTSYHGLIDNSYMFVFLYGGVLVALFFFWIICLTLYRLYRNGFYKELVMTGTMALYGVLEQFVLNGFMNIFLLLCGILLYPSLMSAIERPAGEGRGRHVRRKAALGKNN